ncbi:MAG: type IIA DNA topoisomerase subunit B [Kiritimatiellae bacterium]|nr:type IIA DNA topoisomerase subunit B [Kiritimatiellia bacterium]
MSIESYDDKSIQTLSAIEHIRKRTGMYIGRTGDGSQYEDGIYILLKEVLDNAVDEFIMGCGKRIDISLDYNSGAVAIRDYGRGIPLGKVVDCVSKINTGGKFNDDVFQFSVGMNGVGTKAVNALSTDFEIRSYREGEFSEAFFKCGQLVSQLRRKTERPERNGTYVRFIPDPTIFKNFQFHEDHVERRLRMYAYLNAGLTLNINGSKIVSENGLLDLINDEARFERLYQPFHFRTKTLELVFTHTNRFSEIYYSFVNGQYTHDGGTHLSAFKEGLLKAVNEFSKKKYDGDDVREGIIGAVAIRLKDPIFESQTKNKLGNQEIRSDLVAEIKKAVVEMFHREPTEAEKLIKKIDETKKLRSELNAVKKLSRERSNAVSVRVPQLKDCKDHLRLDKIDKKTGLTEGEDTMIFLTEGLSAGGTLTQCRNPQNQAVFFLRGKPLNVCSQKRDALYKNVEFFNLMKSLDIEESLQRLRYGKIIFATDADVDGLHIRNLLITFFMRFFQQLVADGRVYILETPLFRVRNKKEQHYCFTEEERVAAIAKCGRDAEITRFKGLGELNAKEFKDFIGENMRLTPVTCTDDFQADKTIDFYMGSNTPQRRDYIMKNLVCNEESFE